MKKQMHLISVMSMFLAFSAVLQPARAKGECRLSLNRRWDFLVEVGSNFDDTPLLFLSSSIRF